MLSGVVIRRILGTTQVSGSPIRDHAISSQTSGHFGIEIDPHATKSLLLAYFFDTYRT